MVTRDINATRAVDTTEESLRSVSDQRHWRELVEGLASQQLELYAREPIELIGHANRETGALDGLRGRQILELLQNADDAADNCKGGSFRVHISRDALIAANTGTPFSERGIKSLVISDASPKQLAQNRFIGCKGLGFRSVLTWTQSPLVVSGDVRVSFDRPSAEQRLRELASQYPDLEAELVGHEERFSRLPIPLMRFPAWADDELCERIGVSRFLTQGFDTVVALPFSAGPTGDRAHAEALAQLEALSPDTLLFCRNLSQIRFTGDCSTDWELIRERIDEHRERIIINDGSGIRMWTVHRRTGQIPESEVPLASNVSRDFEIAVAVPESALSGEGNRLCVFFPTQVRLPLAVCLHATLELTDNRNRLIDHDANKYVLAKLASLLASVIEDEAARHGGRCAIELIDGLQDADPELDELGFVPRAVEELGQRDIFPRLTGDVAQAGETRRTPDEIWTSVLLPESFPEVLESSVRKLTALLGLFGIGWYESDELTTRLQDQIRLMPRAEAGALVGRLLARGRLSGVQIGDLVLDVEGRFVGATQQSFFHPTSNSAQLRVPEWAQNVRFVKRTFQTGLIQASGAGSLRALSDQIRQHGGRIDEYRLDTVTRALISGLSSGLSDDDLDRVRQRWRDLLLWLFQNSRGGLEQLLRLHIRVLTCGGDLKPAQELYLNGSYPHGRVLGRLYGPFGVDEFVAGPQAMGITGADVLAIETFLKAVGVKSTPKLGAPDSYELRHRFTEMTLERQSFPLSVRDELCGNADAIRAHCRVYEIEGLDIPDRFDTILEDGDPAALVAYLLGDGAPLITNERSDDAVFSAKIGREQYSREDRGIQVPNPVLWMLREIPWVPCADGLRRCPREIILSDVGARLFHGVFWKHAIDTTDPFVRDRGGAEAVTGLLMRLGAVASLADISDDALYGLLSRLPQSDPDGRTAPSIYRTLVDASRTPVDARSARRFHEHGRVWTKSGSGGRYVAVAEARYNSALMLPKAVERELALIDIPRRKNTKVIEAIFGVHTLQSKDVHLVVDLDFTEFDPSSELANAALGRCLPYVYALRLHKRADDDGRERSLLNRLKLRVCRQVHVRAQLPQNVEQSLRLQHRGERIAVGTDLYVVGEYAPGIPSARQFWLWVASLIAEVLGSDVTGDVALILCCEHAEEMADTVRDLVGDEAEEKLAEARRRMEEPLPPAPPKSYPIQGPAEPHGEDSSGPTERDEGVSPTTHGKPEKGDGSQPQTNGRHEFTVQPGTAPSSGPLKRRKLVVAGSGGGGRPGAGLGPVATEEVTFRVVEAFERLASPPRISIDVSHIRGAEGLGCDLVSVASEEIKKRILERGTIEDSEILRYIEVKGRSTKTGLVELTENELERARQARDRYFVYRVFVDVSRSGHFEIAVLRDPTRSNAVRHIVRLDLGAGSDAEWFNVEETAVPDEDVGEPEKRDE